MKKIGISSESRYASWITASTDVKTTPAKAMARLRTAAFRPGADRISTRHA